MEAKGAAAEVLNPASVVSVDHKRDAYGFAVRPQHLQRYREYANIYKEEEEERSDRWKDFLERQCGSAQLDGFESSNNNNVKSNIESAPGNHNNKKGSEAEDFSKKNPKNWSERNSAEANIQQAQMWKDIRPSLCRIEDMMSSRVKKKANPVLNGTGGDMKKSLSPIEEARPGKGASDEDSDEEFYDLERSESDSPHDIPSADGAPAIDTRMAVDATNPESLPPLKDELECLVRDGVPMALRGELWQAFVGARVRRVEKYYDNLLAPESKLENKTRALDDNSQEENHESVGVPEKWKIQIEKDLPRTFPGHPALDEDGRNALRRILTAYARHNPSVGYCQAMNFFAGLLLLLMPEENAFWTLVGILDDYFDGYYTEEMIESQVDQLVLEELVRERFPKLVNHLDYLGVQVAWVTGPWFLSIYMNMLPWESVLRVWDVLLFEGSRVMLFRAALALLELYGPALVTTKDAGDAITLLQSLAGSTFDSSQLVFTACMGFQNVQESQLEELRNKHRPPVREALKERTMEAKAWKDSHGLASKFYSFKKSPDLSIIGTAKHEQTESPTNGNVSHVDSSSDNDGLYMSMNGTPEIDSAKDLEEQVVWLKVELCKLIDDKRSSELRAEELETALMEMVKHDNRRQLSARVEQLERNVEELKQALADKQEQENAMLQILMRVEQEQKVTEDARLCAEQDAAANRHTVQVLQERYEEVTASLADMEKRAVMAESMLEATLQYQSGHGKAQPSPRSTQQSNPDSSQEIPTRKIGLLSRPFGLGWRDKNKGKPANADETNGEHNASLKQETNGHPTDKV
ncbi:uncharacterized protein LOC127243855 [Andrographis paniculata]|uniref:uncharacterized protein LOC127243855 n=1 Tax=Andrographis paniculata TaxID=175694 RepID=UPI0021E843F4|nr:uncharacterized protein LOC127243855 [Andrographis paniculata]